MHVTGIGLSALAGLTLSQTGQRLLLGPMGLLPACKGAQAQVPEQPLAMFCGLHLGHSELQVAPRRTGGLARLADERLHDERAELALRQGHEAAAPAADQPGSKGAPVLCGAMQQRSLDYVAGARVLRIAVRVSAEDSGDVVTVRRLAVLQDRLHDVVPERVPAELAGSGQHLAQELRQARAAPGMFQQAADDAAAKPVARHGNALTSQLFCDKARKRCGHDLHNLLDYVVCVRRLNGRPDIAVQL
mmetsp:Transcript_98821/g.299955  ORF Transcript_98821/g.299955 Transcript_98821/m.299955 type:complete len:246 (+) Transcript_98821:385-1122(+)